MEVALLQNLRVKVNGASVSLPYYKQSDLYIAENGYLTTVTTGIGVQVIWDGDSYTEVHVPKRYQNKTCGFCGNFNGDPDDDFTTPDGEVIIILIMTRKHSETVPLPLREFVLR